MAQGTMLSPRCFRQHTQFLHSTRCSQPKQQQKQGKENRQRRCKHQNTENPKTFLSHAFPIASFSHPLHKSYCKLFPLRPACCLASSQRSSPKLFPRFPIRPVVSFPSSEAPRKLFARFPLRPACCLILSRFLPAKLSASYFHSFRLRAACCLAPSQRSFLKLFPRHHPVQHAVSLPSSATFRKLFARFLLRPACCLAPSHRSFPKLFPRFCPVQHAVALPPSTAFRPACCLAPIQRSFPKLFSTVLSRPACCLAPSPRSFPKLFPRFCSVQHPVSLPPSEVSPSYFPRFCPVQHAVSLPPSEVSPSYFHGFIPSSIRSRSLPVVTRPSEKNNRVHWIEVLWKRLIESEGLRYSENMTAFYSNMTGNGSKGCAYPKSWPFLSHFGSIIWRNR